jgi:hypothetical protein
MVARLGVCCAPFERKGFHSTRSFATSLLSFASFVRSKKLASTMHLISFGWKEAIYTC